MNRLWLALSFAGGVVIAAGGWLVLRPAEPAPRTASELMDVVMWNTEPIGGPFALIDHEGRPRTDAEFRGKLLLIYFGFTFCAVACPAELQSIATALDRLGPAAERIQPLFITVDPERDTPAQLKGYVALIHPRLIGLTGSERQIREVARAYKVYYAKAAAGVPAGYDIDHMGFTFIVGSDGKYLGYLPPGTTADRLIETVRPLLPAPTG